MKKGFTLIELLVVVLIIGVLAAIALPQYERAVLRARTSEMMIIGKTIKDAQQTYYMTNGFYAQELEGLGVDLPCAYSTQDQSGSGIIGRLDCKESVMFLYPSFVSPHLKNEEFFWINMHYAGGNLCSAQNKRAEGLCINLGGVYAYTDGEGIKRYNL